MIRWRHRPVKEVRGSARSVAGVNITTVLAANAHLLTGYGGHTMAAGLRLKPENIGRLRRALGRTVHSMRGEVTPGTLTVDIETQIPAVSLDLVAALEQLAPFGPGMHWSCWPFAICACATPGRSGVTVPTAR